MFTLSRSELRDALAKIHCVVCDKPVEQVDVHHMQESGDIAIRVSCHAQILAKAMQPHVASSLGHPDVAIRVFARPLLWSVEQPDSHLASQVTT